METFDKPKQKKMDQETYKTWWTNKENFSEKYLTLYKEILNETHAIYQNNNSSTRKPKSSSGKKWKDLVSKIWREIRAPKVGSGIIKKYNEGPVEYRYIDSINKLLERIKFINAEGKAGNNNFHNEKLGISNFLKELLENIIDTPKSIEYISSFVKCVPKGLLKKYHEGSRYEYIDSLNMLLKRLSPMLLRKNWVLLTLL